MAGQRWRPAILSLTLLAVACAAETQGTQQAISAGDTPHASTPPAAQSATATPPTSQARVTTQPPVATGAPSQPATVPSPVSGWPPYPGETKLGDRGDHVRVWQQILIQAGAISDIPENHDG
jgi:hypothetical protein